MKPAWYQVSNDQDLPSPALLVYPERIKSNIREMIKMAGGASRLRPHVKTHKCREIVALQQDAGINRFKCATIAEAEMLAECKAADVLLAYQPVGPTISRYLDLIRQFPDVRFSAVVDNIESVIQISKLTQQVGTSLGLFIDLDVGMHRTGIPPGDEVIRLMESIIEAPAVEFHGWHVYDGHIRESNPDQRQKMVASYFEHVADLVLSDQEVEVVAGGSPTFPIHASNTKINLSPGTTLLWDYGYSQTFPDQPFKHAAVLMTRVISKPGPNLVCLDLGHKAVASEMPHPRVYFPGLSEQPAFRTHSEEHLVMELNESRELEVGAVLYAIPMHICPTVALHSDLIVVEHGMAKESWKVYARDRRLSV